MRKSWLNALLAFGILGACGAAHAKGLQPCVEADIQTPPVTVSSREAEKHLLSDMPLIVYPHGHFQGSYYFSVPLLINTDGKAICYVTDHDLPLRTNAKEKAAIQALDRLTFKPFIRKGQAIVALATIPIIEEEALARAIAIPQAKPEDTVITLSRTGCYGTCPAYTVTISGAGRVHYEGRGYSLITGDYDYDISPEAVARIMDAFDAAQFWALNDAYVGNVTDNPSTFLTLNRAGRTKELTDYVGGAVGMPRKVTDLEEDIDRLSGALDLTRGSETMLSRLDALGYDFKSGGAQGAMVAMVSEGSAGLIDDFFERGVAPEAALEPAASAGRYDVFKLALARGAEIDPQNQCDLQISAAATGDLDFFMAIADLHSGVCQPETILNDIADQYFHREEDGETGDLCNTSGTWCFRPQKLKILQYLLDNKANVYAVNEYGRYPIDYAYDEDTVKAYLAAGYDINFKDAKGDTALTRSFSSEQANMYLRLGADPFVKNNDGLDYYKRAKESGDQEGLAYIDAHRSEYKDAP